MITEFQRVGQRCSRKGVDIISWQVRVLFNVYKIYFRCEWNLNKSGRSSRVVAALLWHTGTCSQPDRSRSVKATSNWPPNILVCRNQFDSILPFGLVYSKLEAFLCTHPQHHNFARNLQALQWCLFEVSKLPQQQTTRPAQGATSRGLTREPEVWQECLDISIFLCGLLKHWYFRP